jgi:5-bromo-4-chloroindolyl phosphate hydrolysis protein
MDSKDWENLGKNIANIQNTVQDAVDSKNFQQLNQSITNMVNKTISQYQANMPKRAEQAEMARRKKELEIPAVYGQVNGYRTGSIVKVVCGSVVGCGCVSGLLAVALIQLVSGAVGIFPAITLTALAAASGGVVYSGCRGILRAGRFRKYVKTLGHKTYCSFGELARAVGKPIRFVQNDVKYMIDRGWFIEGHVDQQQTLLITTNETYSQYQITQKQLEERQQAAAREQQASEQLSPEVREVLRKGQEYLQQIRDLNEEIPGTEISGKISALETTVDQIFRRVREHPEVVPDLKRMMDYYLPTTIKLLTAYADMDRQPIQGENILNSKREIEQTLDTLNNAFHKLLDSIFQDTAWDVASDISVLNTILAQEGLTDDGFGHK